MVELCPLDRCPGRRYVLYIQQRQHLTYLSECDTIEVMKDGEGFISQSNGSSPFWFLHWLAVPENICDFSLKPAGEAALLIVFRNVDVSKHGRQCSNGNPVGSLLILTHRMPPVLLICSVFTDCCAEA